MFWRSVLSPSRGFSSSTKAWNTKSWIRWQQFCSKCLDLFTRLYGILSQNTILTLTAIKVWNLGAKMILSVFWSVSFLPDYHTVSRYPNRCMTIKLYDKATMLCRAINKTGSVRVALTLRCVHANMLPWKGNQYYIQWVCVCSLSYPMYKAHAPYYIVICDLSGTIKCFHIIS